MARSAACRSLAVAAMFSAATACSLFTSFDGVSNGHKDARDDRGPTPDGPNGLPSDSGGPAEPGCPGCEVIVPNEDNPAELVQRFDSLYWARDSVNPGVVESDLDGKNPTFETTPSKIHDVTVF